MTILQMKYFIAICESGSLTTASKSLFVTQPALSSSIQQLEKEYHVKLFERKNHGLTLTAEGEFFYERAKQLLVSYDILDKDLKDLSKKQFTIRIGVPPMIGSFLFPKIYNAYMQTHPDAKFEIWEEGSLSIRKKIQNKILDIGFSILNDSGNEFYEKEDMIETELLYCVSASNPISNKSVVTIEDIKDEPIIILREGFFQNQLINQLFSEVNQVPNIILVSTQLSVIKNFVKMNAGGAFLMKELLDKEDQHIVGIPFKEKLMLNIGLIWRKESQLNNGVLEFIQFLRQDHKI